MRVICLRAHGGLDQLKLENWPEPEPGPEEVLVEVKACGLNYLDIFVRHGMPGLPTAFPQVPGGDIAGIVRKVGEGVSEDKLCTQRSLYDIVNID